MISKSIINALTRGVFAIDVSHVETLLPIAIAIASSGKLSLKDIPNISSDRLTKINATYALEMKGEGYSRVNSEEELSQPSIFVVSLRGIVMKHGEWGVPGTAELITTITEAMRSPSISSVLFIADTPGGDVDGTFELAEAITAIQEETGKPIIGYVDGTCCSAGIAILSRCKEVYASHATANVGSIGVFMSTYVFTELLKKHGIEQIIVTAPNSPDKNKDVLEAFKGNTALYEKKLATLQDIFQASVKTGRPNISPAALTGACYLAQEAIDLGIIDGIMTLEQTINHLYSLTNQNT